MDVLEAERGKGQGSARGSWWLKNFWSQCGGNKHIMGGFGKFHVWCAM